VNREAYLLVRPGSRPERTSVRGPNDVSSAAAFDALPTIDEETKRAATTHAFLLLVFIAFLSIWIRDDAAA